MTFYKLLLCWEVLGRSGPLGVKMKVSGAGYVGSICLSSSCLSLWFKVSEVLESLVQFWCVRHLLLHSTMLHLHNIYWELLWSKNFARSGYTLFQTSRCFCSCPGPKSGSPCQHGPALTVLLLVWVITSGSDSGPGSVCSHCRSWSQHMGAQPPGFRGSSLPGHLHVPSPTLREGDSKTDPALVRH